MNAYDPNSLLWISKVDVNLTLALAPGDGRLLFGSHRQGREEESRGGSQARDDAGARHWSPTRRAELLKMKAACGGSLPGLATEGDRGHLAQGGKKTSFCRLVRQGTRTWSTMSWTLWMAHCQRDCTTMSWPRCQHDSFLLDAVSIGPAVKGALSPVLDGQMRGHLEQEPNGARHIWEAFRAFTRRHGDVV